MFHYHYIKVIADSENMSTEETIVLFCKNTLQNRTMVFTSKSTWIIMPLISMAAENGSCGWKEIFCG